MMQTIGYQDRGDPRRTVMHCFTHADMTRGERMQAALYDLRGLGNCRIYRVQVTDSGKVQRYRLINRRD